VPTQLMRACTSAARQLEMPLNEGQCTEDLADCQKASAAAAAAAAAAAQGGGGEGGAGAASVASFLAAVLTEIYLCNVCAYQEILRRNGRG
jgi:hypothetical protein